MSLPVDPRAAAAWLSKMGLSGADATALVSQIVSLAQEAVVTHQVESTKRQQIAAELQAELEEIAGRRQVFLTYLDRSFDERKGLFENLFGQLDKASDRGDTEAFANVLDSIANLAAQSPFRDLKDGVALRRKLDDPEFRIQA